MSMMKTAVMFTLALTAAASELPAQSDAGAKELFGGGRDPSVVGYHPRALPEKKEKETSHQGDASMKRPNPLGLKSWIELVAASGQAGKQVIDTRTFQSGEKIRLHFSANTDGRILIIQIGASGTSSVLFPDPVRGLVDNEIHAGADRVLPSEKHWFRFDENPGTERLLVLFARSQADLERFPTRPQMDSAMTLALLEKANLVSGSKDLVIESVEDEATYAVSKANELVVVEIALKHR